MHCKAIQFSDEIRKIRLEISSLLFFTDSSFILLHSYFFCTSSIFFSSYDDRFLTFFYELCPYLLFSLSQQIVLEDLRPALTDQVQLSSNRSVQHRLDSPARAEPPSTSFRPTQVVLGCGHWETLFVHSLIPAWTHWSVGFHVCHLISAPSSGWQMCSLSTRLIVTNGFISPVVLSR